MPGAINWNVAPSANDVSDPPILFNEGQPAKTINDAMRAVMASVALWMLDNSGVNQAYGSDAYTVITRQGVSDAAAAKVHTLKFRTTTTNLNPCTLSPDGQPAKPWLRSDGSQFGPGDIYPTVWSVAFDPDAGVYRTLSPTTPPAGLIVPFAGPNLPAGFEVCDGRAVSRASYAALFASISTLWGNGDGFQTFNLPDMRGRTLFGANRGLSVLTAAGGLVGSLGLTGGAETVALLAPQMPSHIHTASTAAAGAFTPTTTAAGGHDHGGTQGAGGHSHTGATDGAGQHTHTGSTQAAGDHAHQIQHARAALSTATPNNAAAVTAIYPNGTMNSGGQTDNAGVHAHGLTIDPAGNHAHSFTTDPVGAHVHALASDGQHVHPITPIPAHTHPVTVDAAGSGAAHPNVPPGAVVIWAIKT